MSTLSRFFPAYRPPIWLLLIVLLAFGLRIYKSGAYGLYFDEKYTLSISQGIVLEGANQKDVFFVPGKVYFTPAEFWKPKTFDDFVEASIRGDIGNSPTYYALLWTWMNVFGLSDFAMRLPSVLFSIFTVWLVFVFVRRHLKSESLAYLCAFLTAIEPFFVAYSHMARNYSLSFFLTLLATHVFLLILDRQRSRQGVLGLYVAYGTLFALSVLSHYLTVTVFLCHGLYLLFFARDWRLWGRFAIAYGLAFIPVVLWFTNGGGRYTFQTLAHQARLYKQVALTSPTNNPYGLVLPATVANVAKRSLPILADLFILTNGVNADVMGYRNLLIALVLGLGVVWCVQRYRRATTIPLWASGLVVALLLVGLPLYSVFSLQFIVAATVPLFVYLLYVSLTQNRLHLARPLLVLLGMLALLPTFFLIFMSFRNGHTYGITQRYSGFSFPYAIVFMALVIREALYLPAAFRNTVMGVLALQSIFIGMLLVRIYQDRDQKYTYFNRPRIENPYYTSAQRIKEAYAEGDTLLYPSMRLQGQDAVSKTYSPYSIADAQLTNLYLPKGARYWQRLDTTQANKIVLVKGGSGQKITLFDFKGKTYRY